MAVGTATLDFGAFPGVTDVYLDITGQSGILSGSLVEAWVFPANTADHSVDEHIADPPRIVAGNVSAGVGFTIYGVVRDPATAIPDARVNKTQPASDGLTDPDTPMCYGQWNIAWTWS